MCRYRFGVFMGKVSSRGSYIAILDQSLKSTLQYSQQSYLEIKFRTPMEKKNSLSKLRYSNYLLY